jgi:hypothetical protein
MLSLQACRELLGPGARGLCNEQLAHLREQFYCLAQLMLDRRDSQNRSTLENPSRLPIDRETLEERAAIMEFEGNLSREDAERNAVALALENDHLN